MADVWQVEALERGRGIARVVQFPERTPVANLVPDVALNFAFEDCLWVEPPIVVYCVGARKEACR